jgi:tape measure domain-containing protein
VKGTAFALDEAANTAASAVAAGVKPGEQLTEYLENIADAAAVAGVSFEEMASIFNKARTNTVVYTDDLQQLADRGIPIFQWLAEEYGVTQQQLTKMVEQGQVDAQHFEAAIDKHIGGAAQKMGQSWSGAVDNLQASVARVGANFLTQIFGGDNTSALAGPTAAVESLTGKLNEFDGWVTAHGPEIKGFFNDAKEVGRAFVDAIVPPLQTAGNLLREHPGLIQGVVGAYAAWKTIEGVAALTTSLKAISTLLSATIPASAGSGGWKSCGDRWPARCRCRRSGCSEPTRWSQPRRFRPEQELVGVMYFSATQATRLPTSLTCRPARLLGGWGRWAAVVTLNASPAAAPPARRRSAAVRHQAALTPAVACCPPPKG